MDEGGTILAAQHMRRALWPNRKFSQQHQGVAQGVAKLIWILAKCWSEWQDLNLRPPRPERGALPTQPNLLPIP